VKAEELAWARGHPLSTTAAAQLSLVRRGGTEDTPAHDHGRGITLARSARWPSPPQWARSFGERRARESPKFCGQWDVDVPRCHPGAI